MTLSNIISITKRKLYHSAEFFTTFLRWSLIAAIVGLIGGIIGSAFHISVDYCTEIRMEHNFFVLLLPLGGIAIVRLYKLCNMSKHNGTDNIIESIREQKKIPFRTAPLIFIATVITHLFGGSAGREGAALQLGGSIGFKVGEALHLDKKDRILVVMCGMSAFFSALFGTPLTAAIFAIEVTSVGVMYYAGLIPCIVSALTAFGVSTLFGVEGMNFYYICAPTIDFVSVTSVILISIACAVTSIIFCMLLHHGSAYAKKLIKSEYLRIVIGSVLIIILTYIFGNDYNGAGTHIITDAANGTVKPEAFILKIIFTVITIAVGFKGGEIVPTFFIGATLGCFLAQLTGMDAGFGAAVGMTGMFCGMLNCPIASLILSVEMFGDNDIILFAITCAISYMLSGYYGLYHSQKIMYSKTRTEFINKDAR